MSEVIASILHGAYGDVYEQALCLKHYAMTHPNTELKLFFSRSSRMESFRALDFSFASTCELWTRIPEHDDIDRFYQFQVLDGELTRDVLQNLPEQVLAKIDRTTNHIPWIYMRDNRLLPAPGNCQLPLSQFGCDELKRISLACGIEEEMWRVPTISFLWRYRYRKAGAVSGFGQKSQESLVRAYSSMFRRFISKYNCRILICGMNLVTTDSNRESTDNKYPAFGLDLPEDRTTYLKGLCWPVELEIASRATVCCGNASGFTEALWLKRGSSVVLMDPPPHYLAKAFYHRMQFWELNRPLTTIASMPGLSPHSYQSAIDRILKDHAA